VAAPKCVSSSRRASSARSRATLARHASRSTSGAGEPHARHVAGVHVAVVGVVQRDVVRRVPGRVQRDEPPPAAEAHRVAVAQRREAVRRHRLERPPQPVHRVAVDPRGARQELGRVHHVRRAGRVHVEARARRLAQHRARRAGVIEVDVRDHHVRHALERVTGRRDRGAQRRQRGARPRLHEHEVVAVGEQERGDRAGEALEAQVEQVHVGRERDGEGRRHRRVGGDGRRGPRGRRSVRTPRARVQRARRTGRARRVPARRARRSFRRPRLARRVSRLSSLVRAMSNPKLDTFRAMVAHNPDNSLARFGLANEAMKAQLWDEAIEHLEAYLARYDDEGNGWGRLAEALQRLDRADEAREALRKGIAASYRFGHGGMAAELEERLEAMD
jgi:hypothetical protein